MPRTRGAKHKAPRKARETQNQKNTERTTAVGASAPTAFSVIAASEAMENATESGKSGHRRENRHKAGRSRESKENAAEGKKPGHRREKGHKAKRRPGKRGKTPQRVENQAIEGKTGEKQGEGRTRKNGIEGKKPGHRRENRQKRGKSDEKPGKRSDLRGFAAKTGTQRENNAVRPKLPFAMPLIGHKITKMLF